MRGTNDTQVSGLSNWELPATDSGNDGGGIKYRLDDAFIWEYQTETSLEYTRRGAQYVAGYGTKSRKKFWSAV